MRRPAAWAHAAGAGARAARDRALGAASTYTAVLRGHGRTFALCDEAEQASLVGGWAEVLAGMADSGSPISRLQVIERTLPDTGEDAARYLRVSSAFHRPRRGCR